MRIDRPSLDELAAAMITLADAAERDLDVAEHAESVALQCAVTLGVDAAGILLAYPEPRLRAVAGSNSSAQRLMRLQAGHEHGPAAECYRLGRPVSVPDLSVAGSDATVLVEAGRRGFRSLHTIPVRWRGEVVGVGQLFSRERGELSPATGRLAQALLGAAAVGLAHHRELSACGSLVRELRTALGSRVVIEQAKGILAARHGITVDVAFEQLRQRARGTNRKLHDVAREIIHTTTGNPSSHGGPDIPRRTR